MASAGLAIPIIASTFVVLTTLLAISKWLTQRWQGTVGARRRQSYILNQLVCGATAQSVNALLGEPKFIRKIDNRFERTFRLDGAWVTVEFEENPENGAPVVAFSITVTDRRHWFDTGILTGGFLDIRLGEDTAIGCPESQSEWLWFGASRGPGYLRHHYFGNPGGYQNYWLSHNDAGCGDFASYSVGFKTGQYSTHDNKPSVPPNYQDIVTAVTVNTLTVLGPMRAPNVEEQFFQRDMLGVERTVVRLDRSSRPSKRQISSRLGLHPVVRFLPIKNTGR
ncbi:hypothetical protein GOEFS_124_00400 [Gordonia effusa NBRC 100432]|uniref:Uncharacterized protein n=1 Tax=Gordonia effusa NBRC 100432 TaxID=1077974 RepID=H0R6K7_9ACTN|nr:ETEC_3214 domain-containing protein [Gordonia effusa]GAB20708.1 hypothetical protein GOEFS_124_00400 [Gordonia effusa NBRC 100432]